MKWAYGVTTTPFRRNDLLPATLASLARGGFNRPWLFVDGTNESSVEYQRAFPMVEGVTVRPNPAIRVHGNWVLSLLELFIREPSSDRYAMFQDDFITYANLRLYLERCTLPARGYWNLYTFPSNQELCPKDERGRQKTGWYLSNQAGRGAVGLVFSKGAVLELISSRHMAERPMDQQRGYKAVDGGIVTAMAKASGGGFQEWVHNPSLVQHMGDVSAIGNRPHARAVSFRGEGFDAMELLKEVS